MRGRGLLTSERPVRIGVPRVLAGRWGAICLVLLAAQQALVASSNVWLVRLVDHVQRREPWPRDLAIVVASLLAPYIPGSLAVVAFARWKYDAYGRLVTLVVRAHLGRCDLWPDVEYAKQVHAVVGSQAPLLFEQFLSFAYTLVSCSLNALLNIVVVGLIVDESLIAAYCIGLVGAACVMRFLRPWQTRIARIAQTQHIGLTASLSSFRDDILIGNAINSARWLAQFRALFRSCARTGVRAVALDQSAGLLTSFFIMMPVLAAICWIMSAQRNDAFALATTVVMLPRLFSILSFTNAVLDSLAKWPGQRAKLSMILEYARAPSPVTLERRIRWSEIAITVNARVWSGDLNRLLGDLQAGARVTIRGPNGSGKTSILLSIKQRRVDAVYIPPAHLLTFGATTQSGSTGETVCTVLSELLRDPAVKCLLLDEWDANLDAANVRKITALVEQAAAERTVVEVRHHADADADAEASGGIGKRRDVALRLSTISARE